MNEAEFQHKLLSGIEEMQGQVTDPDRAPKHIKAMMEDVTRLKRTANDQQANMDAFLKKMGMLKASVDREVSGSFRDPIQRVQQDEELRTRLNVAARLAMDYKGDMIALCRPQLKALGITYDELQQQNADRMQTKAGMGEDASPGSLLINDELSRQIYSTLPSFGIWNTLGVVPMGTKTTKFHVDTADPVCLILLTEAESLTDDANIAGSNVSAVAEIFAVLLNVSLQMIQDGEIDISGYVMKKFARSYAKRLDHAGFRAAGVADATDGGFTGLFEFGTAAAAGAGNTTIERTTLDDWIRCLTTVDAEVLNRQPRWWLHPHILARSLSVKDGNGRPIFLTATEAPSFGALGSILGYPVTLGNICPSTNAASSKVAGFGDGEAVALGMRSDYSFDSSDHHKWGNLQRSFRGWGRAGIKGRAASAIAVLTTAAA